MYITSHTLRLALLRILAEAGMRAGDSLSLVTLRERWLQTGLRASDLPAVLQDMVDGGDLLRSERDDGLRYALSACAYGELHRPDGELSRATAEDLATLFEARYRGRGGEDENLKRREADQPHPPPGGAG